MREIAGSKVTEQWCVEERKERKERMWETADLYCNLGELALGSSVFAFGRRLFIRCVRALP